MPLKFSLSNCTGCKLCELACSSAHYRVFNPDKARLKITHEYNDDGIKIKKTSCIHCKKCEKTCPVGAIKSNGRWMVVDRDLCTGCGDCVETCPTGVLYLDREDKPIICDLCDGDDPQCVKWCPKGIISLVEKKGAVK